MKFTINDNDKIKLKKAIPRISTYVSPLYMKKLSKVKIFRLLHSKIVQFNRFVCRLLSFYFHWDQVL